jgi:Xaa-Pro dipeptidase
MRNDNDPLKEVKSAMRKLGLDLIALNPGPTLFYVTGLSFHLMERPTVLLISRDKPPGLILPEFEASKADGAPFEMRLFPYGEDEASRAQAFLSAVEFFGKDLKKVGVEPLRWRYFEGHLLETAAPVWQFTSAASLLEGLRIAKQPQEIEKMRRAVSMAEQALRATMPLAKIGMSERDLASELTAQILRAGSDSELPFGPIVASGPNSALPHATPSDRKLASGDLLIIDWGARYEGYVSDLTRTFAIGGVDPELEAMFRVVRDANAAGRDAVRSGASCGEVDLASRRVIEQAGYGGFFTHRTGHGIGLDTHEPPYIRSGDPLVLASGMTFTIEPGIYLPGRGGARVEDDVLVTESGSESLSQVPRELEVIG